MAAEEPTRFEVPCVDLDDSDADALAAKIDKALKEFGLMFVTNHGVDQALIDRMWKLTRAFHAQPSSAKAPFTQPFGFMGYLDNVIEARFENAFPETCEKAQGNQWPDESTDAKLEGFHDSCVAYASAVDGLGRRLLPLLERAMSLPTGLLAVEAFRDAQYFLNLRHYPDQGAGATRVCCVPPHTDSGVLTFLPQQGKPGFEVCLPDGRWVPVGVAGGDVGNGHCVFLVQGGDCLRRWTNHRYQSALHRVAPFPGRGDRYAMPVFCGPGESCLMSTLPGCSDEANPDVLGLHERLRQGGERRRARRVLHAALAHRRAEGRGQGEPRRRRGDGQPPRPQQRRRRGRVCLSPRQ